MRAVRIITLSLVLALVTPVLNASTIYTNDVISSNEFFLRLSEEMNIDIPSSDEYSYCSPQIGHLVKKGYISPYQAHQLSANECNTEAIIDRALLMVGYFDRPPDKGNYGSIVERVSKEIGLVGESFDFSASLSYKDADDIIDKLAHKKYKKIKYSTIDLGVKYIIDEFYGMSDTLYKVKHYMECLPDKCINEFNSQGFVLRITENVIKYHPRQNPYSTAFIYFGINEIVIMRGHEVEILHEFAHLMFNNIKHKDNVLKKMYETEGVSTLCIKGVRYNTDIEEFYAELFSLIITKYNDEGFMQKFKNLCPDTYEFFLEFLI